MGMFLSGPIIAELSAAPDATDPLAAGRRVLEVVVPLSYRPALKVSGRPRQDQFIGRFSCSKGPGHANMEVAFPDTWPIKTMSINWIPPRTKGGNNSVAATRHPCLMARCHDSACNPQW